MANGSVFKNKPGTQVLPKTSTKLVYDANGKCIDDIIGYLSNLSTTEKSNLVAAINELKSQINKPSGGWAKTDLAAAVQTSLGKADTAVQRQSGKGLIDNNVADHIGWDEELVLGDVRIEGSFSINDTPSFNAGLYAEEKVTLVNQVSIGDIDDVEETINNLKSKETIVISRLGFSPSIGEYSYLTSTNKLLKGTQDEDGNYQAVEVAIKDDVVYVYDGNIMLKNGNRLEKMYHMISPKLVSEISYDQSNGEMRYCFTRIVCEPNEIRSTDKVRLVRYISSKKVYVDDDYDKIIYRKKGWVTPDYRQKEQSELFLYMDFDGEKSGEQYWKVSVGDPSGTESSKKTLAEYQENRDKGDGELDFGNGNINLANKRCALYIERNGRRISEYMPFRVMYIDNWERYIVTIAK